MMMKKTAIRKIAWESLGDLPNFRFIPKVKYTQSKKLDYCFQNKFRFDNRAGSTVIGYLFKPLNFDRTKKYPTIHYLHLHSDNYRLGKDELLKEKNANWLLRKWLKAGFLVYCIDSYCFGDRMQAEIKDEESYLAKYNLLYGRTLWGMMLRDELLLINYIKSLSYINKKRISIGGVSMGCTKALWLSALTDIYQSVFGLLCTTRLNDLIQKRGLNEHGIYYYPFGLLKNFDLEILYSCIYPKKLLLINGENDKLTPTSGVKKITKNLKQVYKNKSANFQSQIIKKTGHQFTREMAKTTYKWTTDLS